MGAKPRRPWHACAVKAVGKEGGRPGLCALAAAMVRAELGTYSWVESSPFSPLEKPQSPMQGFVTESTHVARKRGKQK